MASFNSDLVTDLALRRTVLFLGAGVSKSAKTRAGGRFKEWGEFLLEAAEEVETSSIKKQILLLIDKKDYLFASELLKRKLESRWTGLLQQEFGQVATPSELHKAIIGLDQRIIITTNFDKLIENAWNEINSSAKFYPQVIAKIDHEVFRLLRDEASYIIKLHGTIDQPEEIVFDKTSYHQSAYGNRFYNDLLTTLLLTHTFVFIGFSMDDPAVSLIVEKYATSFPKSRPHYIFQGGNISQDVVDLWKKLRKLYVIPYNTDSGHAQLVDYISELAKQVRLRRNELLAESRF